MLYLQGSSVKLLVLLFLFTSISTFSCDKKSEIKKVAAFITQDNFADLSEITVYYPVNYGVAEAVRAVISLGEIDRVTLYVPTIISEPHAFESNHELADYKVSTFTIKTDTINEAYITVNYRAPKKNDGLITFCMGPFRVYKISELPIKKV